MSSSSDSHFVYRPRRKQTARHSRFHRRKQLKIISARPGLLFPMQAHSALAATYSHVNDDQCAQRLFSEEEHRLTRLRSDLRMAASGQDKLANAQEGVDLVYCACRKCMTSDEKVHPETRTRHTKLILAIASSSSSSSSTALPLSMSSSSSASVGAVGDSMDMKHESTPERANAQDFDSDVEELEYENESDPDESETLQQTPDPDPDNLQDSR